MALKNTPMYQISRKELEAMLARQGSYVLIAACDQGPPVGDVLCGGEPFPGLLFFADPKRIDPRQAVTGY